jgi:hypothetical protein
MAQTVTIMANLSWRIYGLDNGKFLGICDALHITLEDDSFPDLMESMQESLNLLFMDLHQSGDFDRFLREKGWRLFSPMPARITKQTTFRVPSMDIHVRPESDLERLVC